MRNPLSKPCCFSNKWYILTPWLGNRMHEAGEIYEFIKDYFVETDEYDESIDGPGSLYECEQYGDHVYGDHVGKLFRDWIKDFDD